MLSFIVPAHNEELELPATLRAIQDAAGNQPFEIIVVDDSSSDRTAAIAQEHGARVVSIQRRHIAAARNAGARVATGNVFFFVDADTRIEPAHVTEALVALQKGASGGGAWLRFDRKVPFWADVIFKIFSVVYFTSRLAAGAFLFTTRDNFFAVGGFDEQLFAGEETYLSVALKKLGRFRILRTPATTSARKLRMHRPGYVFRRFLTIVFSGPCVLRSRKKLDLWYDGKREKEINASA
jgi:glycosyltransferase involved in cell wall biosynthesis